MGYREEQFVFEAAQFTSVRIKRGVFEIWEKPYGSVCSYCVAKISFPDDPARAEAACFGEIIRRFVESGMTPAQLRRGRQLGIFNPGGRHVRREFPL